VNNLSYLGKCKLESIPLFATNCELKRNFHKFCTLYNCWSIFNLILNKRQELKTHSEKDECAGFLLSKNYQSGVVAEAVALETAVAFDGPGESRQQQWSPTDTPELWHSSGDDRGERSFYSLSL